MGGRVATGLQLEKRQPKVSLAAPICQTSLGLCYSIKAPQRSLTICTGFSVFHMAMKKPCGKSRRGHLLLFYHCVLMNVFMIWSNKMEFTCCAYMVDLVTNTAQGETECCIYLKNFPSAVFSTHNELKRCFNCYTAFQDPF